MKINYYACLLRIRGKSRSASGEREREDAVAGEGPAAARPLEDEQLRLARGPGRQHRRPPENLNTQALIQTNACSAFKTQFTMSIH